MLGGTEMPAYQGSMLVPPKKKKKKKKKKRNTHESTTATGGLKKGIRLEAHHNVERESAFSFSPAKEVCSFSFEREYFELQRDILYSSPGKKRRWASLLDIKRHIHPALYSRKRIRAIHSLSRRPECNDNTLSL
jgi:hypothetical protein